MAQQKNDSTFSCWHHYPFLLIYPNFSRWLCFGMTDWNNGCIVTLLLTYISLESKGNLFMSCCSFSRQFDGTADYMSSPKMDGTMPTCVFWKGWRTHWEFRIHHRFSKCIVYVFIQVFLASHFAFCFNKPTFSPSQIFYKFIYFYQMIII